MNRLLYNTQLNKLKFLVFYCLVFLSLDAIARAGGGGGNSNSGGEGGGAIIYLLARIIFLLPFPLNIIVIAIIIYLVYKFGKAKQQSSVYNNLVNVESIENTDIKTTVPNFNQIEFFEKVKTAFYKIQDAWAQQNLKPVRQFISDGVYQRFESQFIMMRKLEQHNEVSDVKIGDIKIITAENDGNFYIIHVGISASVNDKFLSEKYPQLNSGGYEEFAEYWTFVKKVNPKGTGDIFNTENCPNCGDSTHQKLGEVSKCPSCGTQINTGDYDWVLSEITQPEEFASNYTQLKIRKKFFDRLAEKGYNSSDFSPQYIEDKASNAFLQLKIAFALVDIKRITRFCSADFIEANKSKFTTPYYYNRLFLKDVTLVNIYENDSTIFAALSVTCVSQKVTLINQKLNIINASPITTNEYLILSRSKKMIINSYSALAHNCSSCGAPVENSLQLTCNFCGNTLNDNSKDWIVEKLLSANEYTIFREENPTALNSFKQEANLEDRDFDIRDYALNNMMVVAYSDGILHEEEKEFLSSIAKELKYNPNKIIELFEQVKSTGLALKMPSNAKQREKIINLMYKIANADGDFTDKEKAIIEEAKNMM